MAKKVKRKKFDELTWGLFFNGRFIRAFDTRKVAREVLNHDLSIMYPNRRVARVRITEVTRPTPAQSRGVNQEH